MEDFDRWRELGQQLRADAVRASSAAGSGHPTSSMSAADLVRAFLRAEFDGGERYVERLRKVEAMEKEMKDGHVTTA